jgi:hypothetical protein
MTAEEDADDQQCLREAESDVCRLPDLNGLRACRRGRMRPARVRRRKANRAHTAVVRLELAGGKHTAGGGVPGPVGAHGRRVRAMARASRGEHFAGDTSLAEIVDDPPCGPLLPPWYSYRFADKRGRLRISLRIDRPAKGCVPTMTSAMPLKVIFIAGYGRSGSTLLDIALGQHPAVFGAGEMTGLTRRVWAANEFCACGKRVRSCPFWAQVVASWSENRAEPISKYLIEQSGTESILSWKRLIRARRRRLAFLTRELFEQVSEAAAGSILVDSSKLPGRGFALKAAPGIELYLVHLVRDPRAVIWSKMKRIKRKVEAGVQRELRPRPLLYTALRWIVINIASEMLAARIGRRRTVRVRYEDFVADPKSTLARVLALVGERVENMPDGISARLRPHHQVSGSRHRMQKELLISMDEQWRSSMPTLKQRVVAIVCAPLLWRYGYGWRSGATAALQEALT